MIILGITHPVSTNTGACILINGELVAMIEEERISRVKHAPNAWPQNAIDYCLKEANIAKNQIEHVAIGFGSPYDLLRENLARGLGRRSIGQGLYWFLQSKKSSRKMKLAQFTNAKTHFVNHHLAHAASTYFASDFTEANIISLDGSGGSNAGIIAYGAGNKITIMDTVFNEQSWGLVYEDITEKLGFKRHSGEGKVMGLAAYGTPDPNGLPHINWNSDIPIIDRSNMKKYVKNLVGRTKDEPIKQVHKDIAATLQFSLEKALLSISNSIQVKTNCSNYCLAGGVALNCSANGKLANQNFVENIYVQPAAYDAGAALGAAFQIYVEQTGDRPKPLSHSYYGISYTNQEIESALQNTSNIKYNKEDTNFCRNVAKLLAEGKVVGWFQGRAEFGPRALGARSILGNPSLPFMKDQINIKIKNRESWRPFAPSILEEKVKECLIANHQSPFMILAFKVKPEWKERLISATHIDDTCRPQSVSKSTNPLYWNLINEFNSLTGVPALLNTSFNVAGEPIVGSPQNAISTFLKTDMDILAIGNFIVTKSS